MDHQDSQQISPSISSSPIASVAFPVAIPGLYDYKIPEQLIPIVTPGTPVLVDLKNRKIWGVAVEIKKESSFQNLKEILDCKTGHWTDSGRSLFKLYEWMSAYYQCDLGRIFRTLVSKGIVKAKAKLQTVFIINENQSITPLKTVHQEALSRIKEGGKAFTIKEMEFDLFIKPSTVATLCKKGYLRKEKVEVIRTASELAQKLTNGSITLNGEQSDSVTTMTESLLKPERPYLLHGITGSGKTHVYIEMTRRALKEGKGIIILVPEISLTPQTIQRFRSSLGDVISVIHSHMSDGERRDSVQELVTGTKRVVIGVRSAILAPLDNLGLIIVDEEHDSSYKQSDLEPRYNARDIAVMRGHFQKALVILGSATPSVESYYNGLNGKYTLIKLTQRYGSGALPRVEIVSMNDEHKANNWTILSQHLCSK